MDEKTRLRRMNQKPGFTKVMAEDLLSRLQPETLTGVVMIIGGPDTGKTALVRTLHARLAGGNEKNLSRRRANRCRRFEAYFRNAQATFSSIRPPSQTAAPEFSIYEAPSPQGMGKEGETVFSVSFASRR